MQFFCVCVGMVIKKNLKTADKQDFQIFFHSVSLFTVEQEKEGISDSSQYTWAKSNPLLQPAQLSMGSGLIYFPTFVGILSSAWTHCQLGLCVYSSELCSPELQPQQ